MVIDKYKNLFPTEAAPADNPSAPLNLKNLFNSVDTVGLGTVSPVLTLGKIPAVQSFIKSAAQGAARSVGSAFVGLGELFGGASTLTANDVPEPVRPVWTALFGEEPLKDVAGRVSDLEDFFKTNETSQKYGLNNFAFPLAIAGIGADEYLSFTGLGGESAALKTFIKETNPETIFKKLIDMGVNPKIAEKFAPDFAQATTKAQVKDLFNIVKSSAGLEKLKGTFANDEQGSLFSRGLNQADEQVPTLRIEPSPAPSPRGTTDINQLYNMLQREERSLAAAQENPTGHALAYGPTKVAEYEKNITDLKLRIANAKGEIVNNVDKPLIGKLNQKELEIALKQEAIENNPLKELASHVHTRGEFKGQLPEEFARTTGRSLDEYASDLGYGSSEELRAAMENYLRQKAELRELKKDLPINRRDAINTMLATRRGSGRPLNRDISDSAREQANAARRELGLPPLKKEEQRAFENLKNSVAGKVESRSEKAPAASYKESLTRTLENKQEAEASFQASERHANEAELASLEDTFNQDSNALLDGERVTQRPQKFPELTTDIGGYKDITGFKGQVTDVYRLFKKFFGDKYELAKEKILDPFDEAKGKFIDTQKFEGDELEREIVQKLGIKKGSRESAAVMDFGEKTLTREDLAAQFRPETVDRIVKAEAWFRKKYDDLLFNINRARKEIYGDVKKKKKELDDQIDVLEGAIKKKEETLAAKKNPDTLVFKKLQAQIARLEDMKIARVDLLNSDAWWRGKVIERRADYFHHFKELEGLSGLKNIFESPAGISPTLVGKSEFTKPNSKFLGFAQARLGLKTKHDAVGGLLKYIPDYAYAVHIDPQIPKFRALANELAGRAEKLNKDTPDKIDQSSMIEFLNDYANDLAGKTNPADRFIQKIIPGGRKAMAVINWGNNRVKANTILGNVGSALAQAFNIPQGVASAKLHSVSGVVRSLASIFVENAPAAKSNFLKERYFGSYFNKFDESMLSKPKQFAGWMTGVLDEMGTKFIWNSHYAKGLSEGVANPIKYADDATRSLVAGRGVGEVPLLHKSKFFQIIAPFQLEVGNLWHVMKDMVDKKAFGQLATLFVGNYLMNRVAEGVRGSPVTFDPINALYEGLLEFENDKNKVRGAEKFAGRVGGEVLSNVPLGQTLAQLYPEYGIPSILGKNNLTRKDLFGAANPERFGSGVLLVKGIQDPLFKIVPPFAGGQMKKTLQGVAAYNKGKDITPTGKTRFKIKHTPENLIRSVLFGKSSLPEAQKYYNKQSGNTAAKYKNLF